MRTILYLLTGLFCSQMVAQNLPETLTLGSELPMPDLTMDDASRDDDAATSLGALKGPNGLLVIFTSNTCPFVVGNKGKSDGWEGRYSKVVSQARKLGIGVAFVNSNEAFRGTTESVEHMRMRWKKFNYQASLLADQNHVLADAFGARTTPHVFLFDRQGKLVYLGAIDDNVDSEAGVASNWLADAMSAMGRGEAIAIPQTKNIGCSIKRVQ